MTALLLDPHGDDAALFAAYSCLKEEPLVVVTHPTVPEEEMDDAMEALGCSWAYWNERPYGGVTHVYAPARHEEGHDEHNNAALMAERWRVPVTSYCTYAPRAVRQMGTLVEPEPWMIARKLRALSCFVSQIEQESTRPWFTSLLDLCEWYA